jgi:ubiquinone/menaquinone biosynthesis C-methylase UbiE
MAAQPKPGQQPTPERIFTTIQAFHNAFVLKAAIELDVFTTIAKGSHTAAEIAAATHSAERGMRILCDALTVMGYLEKTGSRYGLAPDSAVFLDKRSQAYMGGAFRFLMGAEQWEVFLNLTESFRNGGRKTEHHGGEPEAEMWVEFARGMVPFMMPAAQAIAQLLKPALAVKSSAKVLDIAAGHGIFGITVAKHCPNAHIHAVDWANVLEVARENAKAHGVDDRHHLVPGNAFDVECGSGYDAVLLTNFLHHFDVPTNEKLLKKLWKTMNPGAQLVILEFVPNDDRVSPPPAAMFSVTMLSNTPAGDAYTFAELSSMCANAGFKGARLLALEASPENLVVAQKA